MVSDFLPDKEKQSNNLSSDKRMIYLEPLGEKNFRSRFPEKKMIYTMPQKSISIKKIAIGIIILIIFGLCLGLAIGLIDF